jgi:hypothetical protein
LKKFYIISISLFLLAGCAQVVAPTGGPKDVTPPKPLVYSPENKSILFHTKKIDITFDEYIQLKDLQKQFIISPPLKYLPVPIVKGKTLEIPFGKDTLLFNTTYTFNFGNGVCDLHEGNALKNFQYVFSTGTYLDSLSIKGVAMDAFTHAPEKEGLVLMYSNLDDSTPYKKQPSYCAQTDDNGNYRIDNIKNGNYRIIALSKPSGDYFYHPYSQDIAFRSGILSLERNDTFNFFLFTEEQPKLQFIKAKGVGKGRIILVFNKAADSIKITPINIDTLKTYQTIYQYSATNDTLTYWTNYPNLDSLRFIVSRKNKVFDTAIVYNLPGHINTDATTTKKKNKKPEKPPSLQVSLNIAEKSPYNYHLPFTLQFTHPVTSFNLSKIKLIQRNDTIPLKQNNKPSPYGITLLPGKDLISDTSYRFSIMPGAFTDLFGYTNDTIILHFPVEEQSFYGTLKLNLSFAKKAHYLVQLLTDQDNIYKQDTISGTGSIFYDGLPPAMYGIRVIKDDNNNGKWDIGNYLKGIEAEKVFYYSDKINIRSNWDLTQDWRVN